MKKSIIYTLFLLVPFWGTSQTLVETFLRNFPVQQNDQLTDRMMEMEKMKYKGLDEVLRHLNGEQKLQAEYAISAFGNYVMLPEKEAVKYTYAKALGKALSYKLDITTKAFLIRQLSLVGSDDAEKYVAPFLNDENLYGNAARALAKMGTQKAGTIMLQALKKGNKHPHDLIAALGSMQFSGAGEYLGKLMGKDEKTDHLVIHALAEIADPASQDLMISAVKKYGSKNGALGDCLLYIQNLSRNGLGEVSRVFITKVSALENLNALEKQTVAQVSANVFRKPFELNDTEKEEGYIVLFDGVSMEHWMGNLTGYVVENGNMVVKPEGGSGGNIYTKNEYSNFRFRFEFMLTPGANNGVGIRTPITGDAAYEGMEIQVLDNEAPEYKDLKPYQYHGSVYGVIPSKRGFLRPTGEWNTEEIVAEGDHIRVYLNGELIVDGDIRKASANGTMDHNKHPGLLRPIGHIGFLGHGSVVKFRNIRIKVL